MIHPKEISKNSALNKLKDMQIEKDYVLSRVLYGISKNEMLSKILVFKGGTVLKKVYFDDYRFSEDLDFTLVNAKIKFMIFPNSTTFSGKLNAISKYEVFPFVLKIGGNMN